MEAQLVHPNKDMGSQDGVHHVDLAFENRECPDLWQVSSSRSLRVTALALHIEGAS